MIIVRRIQLLKRVLNLLFSIDEHGQFPLSFLGQDIPNLIYILVCAY